MLIYGHHTHRSAWARRSRHRAAAVQCTWPVLRGMDPMLRSVRISLDSEVAHSLEVLVRWQQRSDDLGGTLPGVAPCQRWQLAPLPL